MTILTRQISLLSLLLLLPSSLVRADRITLTGGQVVECKIDSVQNGNANIISGTGSYPVPVNSIIAVEMATPADLTAAATADPATVVTLLEPLIAKYDGLPAPWLEVAMSRLSQAYINTAKYELASTLLIKLETTYPNSPSAHLLGEVGKALISLKTGAPAVAETALAPLLADADKDVLPPVNLQPALASLYLASGQVYDAEKKPAAALEQFMKVKVLLYRDTASQEIADKFIADLKKKYPLVAVD